MWFKAQFKQDQKKFPFTTVQFFYELSPIDEKAWLKLSIYTSRWLQLIPLWIVLNTRHKPSDLDSSTMLEDKLLIELNVFFWQK